MVWPPTQDRVQKYVVKYVNKFRVTPHAQIEHGVCFSSYWALVNCIPQYEQHGCYFRV